MREGRKEALPLIGAVMALVLLASGIIGRVSGDRAVAAAPKTVPLTIQVADSTDPLFVPGTKQGWTTCSCSGTWTACRCPRSGA